MKLVCKKEVWRPTFHGWCVLCLAGAGLLFILTSQLYPFLALQKPLPDAELNIIEGWLRDVEVQAAVERAGTNGLFVTSGGPIETAGDLFEESSYAELMTIRLKSLGIPESQIVTAPAPLAARDRTYNSALAVREELARRNLLGRPANIYSVATHSRRSFLLYRLAFGVDSGLGVISLESQHVDMRRWWTSSAAATIVMKELVSLFYVQCTRWQYGNQCESSSEW